MYALLAAAEPPTLVLMLIGIACLLLYACVRRDRTRRSQISRRGETTTRHPIKENERRAA